MANAFRNDARSAQITLDEVKDEVGPLEKGIAKLMETADRLDTLK